MAFNLLDNGIAIKDGNAAGGDEKERIEVSHVDSAVGNKGKVIRLNVEAVKKPF